MPSAHAMPASASPFPRGSEWRLWDLHIHTPASYNYKGKRFAQMTEKEKGISLEELVKAINESNVAVYAINDYWTFDGYLELRKQVENGSIKKTILPAIELRIQSASSYRLNVHVIFSNNVSIQKLSDFKSHLKLRRSNVSLSDEGLAETARSLDEAKARLHSAPDYLTNPESLFRLGCETAEITDASFQEGLGIIPSHQRLVMVPWDCYGGAEGIDWKVQPNEDLHWLRIADIMEERDADNINLFNGRKTEANKSFLANFQAAIGGRPKPCVSGSDGHAIESFKTWRKETAGKKTWIKADPTFEGLRQILFEPAGRVKVQPTSPAENYEKPFFSSISIAAEHSPFPASPDYENPRFGAVSSIPLNRDLVCLIGGRGAGKSCLMDYLGRAFGASRAGSPYVFSEHFGIGFNKDISTLATHHAMDGTQLPFVYISQNEVKDKIASGTVGDEIKQMLGIATVAIDKSLEERFRQLRSGVRELEDWFLQTDEKGVIRYSRSNIESQISRYEGLLDSITTPANKDKLERFTTNVEAGNNATKRVASLSELKEELENFKTSFDAKAGQLDPKIPTLEIQAQLDVIKELDESTSKAHEALLKDNAEIRADFAAVYSGDLSGLLQNAESYRSATVQLKSDLKALERSEASLEKAIKERARIPFLLARDFRRQRAEINRRWREVQAGHPDWSNDQRDLMRRILADRNITVAGRLIFDEKVFYGKIRAVLDIRSFKATSELTSEDRIRDWCKITDAWSLLRFMERGLHASENQGFVSKEFANLFYNNSERASYLRVLPVITYGGRPLERLSVGQKGTVYLCLKLATQAFSQPLIFDQPEDDLDNEFIIEELVEIFKGIKQFRQVFLITHNANLVVNADAEQVIVASNDDGVLSYTTGSLEDSQTNGAVRRILEGGDEAFRKRELRYNIRQIS